MFILILIGLIIQNEHTANIEENIILALQNRLFQRQVMNGKWSKLMTRVSESSTKIFHDNNQEINNKKKTNLASILIIFGYLPPYTKEQRHNKGVRNPF